MLHTRDTRGVAWHPWMASSLLLKSNSAVYRFVGWTLNPQSTHLEHAICRERGLPARFMRLSWPWPISTISHPQAPWAAMIPFSHLHPNSFFFTLSRLVTVRRCGGFNQLPDQKCAIPAADANPPPYIASSESPLASLPSSPGLLGLCIPLTSPLPPLVSRSITESPTAPPTTTE